MELTIKTSWEELTWREYEQLEQLIETDIPADYKAVHLIALLSGVDVSVIESLPISQVQRLSSKLDFIETNPETHYHKFEYTINDRDYVFVGKIDEITTAQYIDYRSYMNEENKDVVKLMSCFFIPKGHSYNDGYDMEQVQNDIGDMCWLDVRACAFFFNLWLATFTDILKSYSVQTLKKTMKKKTRAEKKEIKKQIKELETSFNNSVWCLLYSRCAANPIHPSNQY